MFSRFKDDATEARYVETARTLRLPFVRLYCGIFVIVALACIWYFDADGTEAGVLARAAIKAALKPGGRLLIDGGDPLREVPL